MSKARTTWTPPRLTESARHLLPLAAHFALFGYALIKGDPAIDGQAPYFAARWGMGAQPLASLEAADAYLGWACWGLAMARAKSRFKGSKYTEPFVGIVRSVFESPRVHCVESTCLQALAGTGGAVSGRQQRQPDGCLVGGEQAGLAIPHHALAL
jgi:hypothetical protein